jgi:hypothetical protein
MMEPTNRAEFKCDNGDASLQNARSVRVKLPARSLIGIGYWIPKSNAYELGSHDSDRSNFIQASKVGRVILNREEVEEAMTEIYLSIQSRTALRSFFYSDNGSEIWTTQRAECHIDVVGNEDNDAESILSIT